MRSWVLALLAAVAAALLLVGATTPAQAQLQYTTYGVITVTYGTWPAEARAVSPVPEVPKVVVTQSSSAQVPLSTAVSSTASAPSETSSTPSSETTTSTSVPSTEATSTSPSVAVTS